MKNLWAFFRRWRKRDETQFYLSVALKNISVPALVFCIITFFFYFFLETTSVFLMSKGFMAQPEVKKDLIVVLSEPLIQILPWLALYFAVFFVIGLWLGRSLLRPFKQIGDLCEGFIEKKGAVPTAMPALEQFPLLRRMCSFFFQVQSQRIRESSDQRGVVIPEEFLSIHGPFMQGRYFFNFLLYIFIICTGSILCMFFLVSELYEQVVKVGVAFLRPQANGLQYFLQTQYSILDSLVFFTGFLLAIGYFILFFNLYGKVSGPAFGILSAMRAFLKGHFAARVHLVGFRYLRPQTRAINRCLDWLSEKS